MKTTQFGHYVPGAHIAILMAHAASLGEDYNPILNTHGLNLKDVSDIRFLLSAGEYTSLLLDIDKKTTISELWTSFGQRLSISSLGPFGQLLISAKNLKKSLELFVQFYPLISCGSVLSLEEKADRLEIIIHKESEAQARESIIKNEILLSSFYSCVCHVLNKKLPMIEFEFECRIGKRKELYSKYLNQNIRFSKKQTKIIVPRVYLDIVPSSQNQVMNEITLKQCMEQMNYLDSEKILIEQVKRLLSISPSKMPSQTEIAKSLGVSSRTFSRKLQELKTSFVELKKQVQFQEAKKYLENTDLSLTEISIRLGFGDPSNFRRAFISWAGISPTQYRKKLG